MMLRRALVTVASTAAIVPAALMAAPAAFADASTAPTPPSSNAPASTAPSTPSSTAPSAPTVTPTPTTPSSAPTPSAPVVQSPQPPTAYCSDQNQSYKPAIQISVTGLPGKIVAGSGWHKFTLTVKNPTKSAITGIDLVAGVLQNKTEKPYTSQQVELQAYNPDAKAWFNVSDSGYSVGDLGSGDLPGGHSVPVEMRLNVGATAPIGKGITFGYGAYPDTQNNCVAEAIGAYQIKIVAPGTNTTGSKPVPTTGGEVPVPTTTKTSTTGAKTSTPSTTANHVVPTSETTAALKGSLAHTGAPSQLPMIAGIGGAAIVAGAGAMFVVRRRKANAQA